MKRIIMGGLLTAATLLGGLALTGSAVAADDHDTPVEVPDDRVCDQPPAHQPPEPATTKSMLLTAPEGKVIVATCVKAGSAVQGEGPEYKTYGAGVDSVTISHLSGKDISHYTVTYADKPTPPPPVEPPPVVTPVTPTPATPVTPVTPEPVVAALPPVAPAAAPPAVVVAATPTQLPSTGTSSWAIALIALASLAGGTGLMRLSRRQTD